MMLISHKKGATLLGGVLLAATLPLTPAFSSSGPSLSCPHPKSQCLPAPGQHPLYFIANQDTGGGGVRFYGHAPGGHAVQFSAKEITVTWPQAHQNGSPEGSSGVREKTAHARHAGDLMNFRLIPLGIRSDVEIAGVGSLPGRVNYFIGKDPAKWRHQLPTYAAVMYREVYPGIDLRFYGTKEGLEYDVLVHPGADPGRVKFQCPDTENLAVNARGDLEIRLNGGGEVIQKKPLVYQEINGQRILRAGEFRFIQGDPGVYGFAVADYDRRYSLVIDPVLAYSTYLGGGGLDSAWGIAVDQAGNAYIIGDTFSTDFPTKNPLQNQNNGMGDVLVAKINSAGALVYATYLGGTDEDSGQAITVDQSGNVYLTGYTYSTDFPSKGPAQVQNKGNGDALVAKLNSSGGLVYATYLGGGDLEAGQGIAVDQAGCAHVTGYTYSTDFPTQGPLQATNHGDSDAFLAKLDAAGSTLLYATYLGGSDEDNAWGIAVDQVGNASLTGDTFSSNFPLKNPIPMAAKGMGDAFLAKVNAAGTNLLYATLLSGADEDSGQAVAVDQAGNAYVTGYTYSTDFPSVGGLQSKNKGNGDAFVAKLNSTGTSLVYSTFLGGAGLDSGQGIAVDQAGNPYVTGYTYSLDFPVKNPLQPKNKGNRDIFVAKLRATGSDFIYSTYLGGGDEDSAWAIGIDTRGNAFISGDTLSSDFPTRNAWQPMQKGSYDAFVTMIGQSGMVPLLLLLND